MSKLDIYHSVPTIDESDIEAVASVLRSKHLEDGEVVREFERQIGLLIGLPFAAATSSGFASIHLSLLALGVGDGDEVILPSYTGNSVLNPVLLSGAKPIIADNSSNEFNLTVATIKDLISKKTKCVIVPHMFGFPAEIEEIGELGIPVIEDCAQSIGGTYNGKPLGSFGTISIFSFTASKMMTSGEGGMVLTNDEKLYRFVCDHRWYAHKKLHRALAYNYHMANLAAGLGLSQFARLNEFIKRRRKLATIYDKQFENNSKIFINWKNKSESIYYRYPIKIENRDEIKSKLLHEGIRSGFGVLDGMHQILELNDKEFPNACDLLSNVLSIPLHPSLTDQETNIIAEKVNQFV